MPADPRILVVPCLLATGALCAQPVPSFPTTAQPLQEIVRASCSGPTRGVMVLRNGEGAVGGYVALPSIMDSPIAYRDAEGKVLTVFHIFDSDAGKAAASEVTQRLKSSFPREEFVPCAAAGG